MIRLKILFITIVVFILLIVLLFFAAHIVKWYFNKKTEEDVLDFIRENPDKASLCVIENDVVVIEYEADRLMPLASVCKIIIAIEFAKQAALGKLDLTSVVSLEQLEKFYIPNSDGGAHETWKKSLKQENGFELSEVSLLDVTKGMIKYSSNANTEYLISLLGLDAINHTIEELCLHQHEPIYPISSGFLSPMYVQERKLMSKNQIKHFIKKVPITTFRTWAVEIFLQLQKDDDKQTIRRLNRSLNFNYSLQKIISAKLPRSTAREYALLMNKLRRGSSFVSAESISILHSIMEQQKTMGSKRIVVGNKGGSTISILNESFYLKSDDQSTMELAIFIHDPSGSELVWLKNKLDLFLFHIVGNERFRNKVVQTLQVERIHS